MGCFAKKTISGFKPVEAEDPKAAYYISTVDEINELREQVRNARDALERIKRRTAAQIEAAYDDSREEIEDLQDRHRSRVTKLKKEYAQNLAGKDEEINALKEQLRMAEADLEKERDLQNNLLRICRERANQKRSIKPKKAHDGYIVIESSQYTEHYREDIWASGTNPDKFATSEKRRHAQRQGLLETVQKTAKTWRSIVQTPYDATIPLADIETRIEEDLWTGKGLLRDLGCLEITASDANGRYHSFGTDETGREINGCYHWRYKANFRQRLWEVEVFTTRPLTVPESRIPCSQRKKQELKSREKTATNNGMPDIIDKRHDEEFSGFFRI